MNNYQILAMWITENLPGCFDGPTPQECLRSAYNAAGVSRQMAVSEFEKCLAAFGFQPVCIRNDPMTYRLNLPDAKSPGVEARTYRYD